MPYFDCKVNSVFGSAALLMSRMASNGDLKASVCRAIEIVRTSFEAGGRLYALGNGGSASEAEHLVGELMGFYRKEHDEGPLPAFALTGPGALITGLINDGAPADIFSRQLWAVGTPRDVLIAFTTSGSSPNVIEALKTANFRGMRIIALLGEAAADADKLADVAVHIPASTTPEVQLGHRLVMHAICACVSDLR